ncbi:MAG TPA: DUF192 domain-containing protein [Candidatus Saccharimonadales bacterium]|nr:DUF192 domain-containing protein [Candidatus Saccharimonadales bacterium]
MKNTVLMGLIFVLVAGLIVGLSVSLASLNCNQGFRTDETISINDQTMNLQIADTTKEQAKGLGGRSCIGENQAMLFEFGKPADYRFWMKGMKFPIDIVWMDADHRVVQINANVTPGTYPETFSADEPVQYVLEMKVGRAVQLGLQDGQTINF